MPSSGSRWRALAPIPCITALFAVFPLSSCGGDSETTPPDTTGKGTAGSTSSSTGAGGEGNSSGSAPIGGNDGAGDAGAGGTGPNTTGEVATVGEPCESPGALACAGNHQKVTLVCGSDAWEAFETCESGEFCDSTPGPDAGLCHATVPGCDEPGQVICVEDDRYECGPDAVTSASLETCEHGCEDGECLPPKWIDDACPDEAPFLDCSGDCAEVEPLCAYTMCDGVSSPFLGSGEIAAGRTIARTAKSLPEPCECTATKTELGWHPATNMISFRFTPPDDGADYHIAVPPPWLLRSEVSADGCIEPIPAEWDDGCTNYTGATARYVTVWTDDPEAPVINVTLEDGECP